MLDNQNLYDSMWVSRETVKPDTHSEPSGSFVYPAHIVWLATFMKHPNIAEIDTSTLNLFSGESKVLYCLAKTHWEGIQSRIKSLESKIESAELDERSERRDGPSHEFRDRMWEDKVFKSRAQSAKTAAKSKLEFLRESLKNEFDGKYDLDTLDDFRESCLGEWPIPIRIQTSKLIDFVRAYLSWLPTAKTDPIVRAVEEDMRQFLTDYLYPLFFKQARGFQARISDLVALPSIEWEWPPEAPPEAPPDTLDNPF
ncbi:hypothetical protein ACFL0N_01095 [Pseudomonadota bacterium]